MNFKPQEFAQSGINFSLFVANTVLNGVERLAVLNLAASRSALEAGISNLNILLGAKDLPSLIELQKSIATPSLEKGVEYSRNVIAIATEAKDKIAKEVEIHVADTKAKVSGLVEKALESAPAHASRHGYVEHVHGANHASLLGRKFADPIVAGVEHVLKAAGR